MWTWPCESLDKRTIRFLVQSDDRRLGWGEVLSLWRDSADFRNTFNNVLAAAPFEAFRWETPPVAAVDMQAAFEFVLVESPDLLIAADPSPFAGHLTGQNTMSIVLTGGESELAIA